MLKLSNLKNLLYIYVLLATFSSFSQKKEELDTISSNYDDYIFAKPGDTITVNLNEITLIPKQNFKAKEDIRYYLWFRRKVFKAYPYAKLASTRLDSLNSRLSKIKSKRKQKRYIKQIQNYIEGEFTDQIKKMTRTEGRILIKLIHRQTGNTVFDNIKQYRSGWKAFWYNTTANVFQLSLKLEYNPELENEDFLIEDILQRAFQDEKLEKQDSKLNFDFTKIIFDRKAIINVEVYKEMFAKMRKKRKKKKRK